MVMVLIIFDIKGNGILFNQCLQCDRALAHSIFIPFFEMHITLLIL